MKKYEFTERSRTIITPNGAHTVYQIRALRDFGNVMAGDLGGWIQHEDNLSHEGNAWVCKHTTVCEDAKVFENAFVYGEAIIYGRAKVYGDATVNGSTEIYDDAKVSGSSIIYGFNNPKIHGFAEVSGNSIISHFADIYERGHVLDLTIGNRSLITFFRNKLGEISVNCGPFSGNIIDFTREIENECSDNYSYYELCKKAIEIAKIQKEIADSAERH